MSAASGKASGTKRRKNKKENETEDRDDRPGFFMLNLYTDLCKNESFPGYFAARAAGKFSSTMLKRS